MGTASSRFAETDWDKVDGGLKVNGSSPTIDGRPPTSSHSILTLQKSNLVDQRTFEIKSDTDEILYKSQPVQGTTKWFDFCDRNGNKLFCVQTNAARSVWKIYSYTPSWDGQVPDDTADLSSSIEMPLYRKAVMDITWNKSHGTVHYMEPRMIPSEESSVAMGTASEEAILKVEEIQSVTAQYQSFVPRYDSPVLDQALHPPLVGWWVWEHTERRHQMKMHLAKGTDVALHCLVAITTNMVHVEKHAEE